MDYQTRESKSIQSLENLRGLRFGETVSIPISDAVYILYLRDHF
jgi:hypothetical protein